jgi:predicted N-acetyltransferase YhbS
VKSFCLSNDPARLLSYLGHPEYYPNFSFEPASRHGIACQWPGVPDETFMIKIFDAAYLAGISGMARYAAAFNDALQLSPAILASQLSRWSF